MSSFNFLYILAIALAILFLFGLQKYGLFESKDSYLPPHASTFESFTGLTPDEYGTPKEYILNLAQGGNNLMTRRELFAEHVIYNENEDDENKIHLEKFTSSDYENEPQSDSLDISLKRPVTSSYMAYHPDQTIIRQTENSNRLQSLIGLPEVGSPQTVEGFEGIYSPAEYSLPEYSIDMYSKFRGSPECINNAFGLSNSKGPLCVEDDEVAYNLLRQRGGNAVYM